MIRKALILSTLLLTACASTPDAGYSAYLDAVRGQQQQTALQMASIADASACNGDATCVVAAKGFAALAAQGGSNQAGIQQYQRQPSAAERITLGFLSALPGLGQIYATIEAGNRSVDIARIGAQREIGIAGAWAGAVGSGNAAWSAAFSSLPPTTSVGGDLISGTQHIGDTVSIGRDQIGGDQHVGDSVGRDAIAGDQHVGDESDVTIGRDDNSGNSGRIYADGPFDNSGQCTGERCQGDGDVGPLPPVVPVPRLPGGPIVGPAPPGG